MQNLEEWHYKLKVVVPINKCHGAVEQQIYSEILHRLISTPWPFCKVIHKRICDWNPVQWIHYRIQSHSRMYQSNENAMLHYAVEIIIHYHCWTNSAPPLLSFPLRCILQECCEAKPWRTVAWGFLVLYAILAVCLRYLLPWEILRDKMCMICTCTTNRLSKTCCGIVCNILDCFCVWNAIFRMDEYENDTLRNFGHSYWFCDL